MKIQGNRFDRSERLFGKEGQKKIKQTTVAIVGAGGGLGTHVVQQVAILGVGGLRLIEHDELDETNRNRYVGVWHDDPIPGSRKVSLVARHAQLINPDIDIKIADATLLSSDALDLICEADYVFGCVDNDGVRFILNEMCLAYDKPLIDLASDVPEPGIYGGRVFFVTADGGCLHCRGILDQDEVRRYLSTQEMLETEDKIYGVDSSLLGGVGPSVGPINGVVANMGVMEFMVAVTGLRAPMQHIEYRGDLGVSRLRKDRATENCYYCNVVKGQGDNANIERYFSHKYLKSA